MSLKQCYMPNLSTRSWHCNFTKEVDCIKHFTFVKDHKLMLHAKLRTRTDIRISCSSCWYFIGGGCVKPCCHTMHTVSMETYFLFSGLDPRGPYSNPKWGLCTSLPYTIVWLQYFIPNDNKINFCKLVSFDFGNLRLIRIFFLKKFLCETKQ
jgi:hypothetical protein